MSETPPPPLFEPPSPIEPPKRHGCLTALMVIAGVIMLLPGLCALTFGLAGLSDFNMDGAILSLVLLGLGIGVAGIFLIRVAIRAPRP